MEKIKKCFSRYRLTYLTVGLYFLFSGLEYAVMLPTMWLYISSRYGAEDYFLGLMLSFFSVSDMIFSPVYGRLADKTRKVKYLILFSNLFEIFGNMLYFFGISKWVLVASRFITGCGAGAGGAVISEITRTVSAKKRTGILAMIMLVKELGIIVGPACNLFLRLCDFTIFGFNVDAYTVPGLFMAVLFVLLQIMVVFCYTDFNQLPKEDLEDQVASEGDNAQAPGGENTVVRSDPVAVDDARQPLINGEASGSFYGSVNVRPVADIGIINTEVTLSKAQSRRASTASELVYQEDDETMPVVARSSGSINEVQIVERTQTSWSQFFHEFIRDDIIAVLAVIFFVMLMQTTLETILTPLTEKLYKWGELENSLIFFAAGIETVLVFIVLKFVSRCVTDRWVIVGSLLLAIASMVFALFYLPQAQPGDMSTLPYFIVGIFLDLVSIPPLLVCSMSLYSKLLSPEIQGISQGVRRSVFALGTILGPLWGSSLLDHLYIMIGFMSAGLCLSLIGFLLSFRRLDPCDTDSS